MHIPKQELKLKASYAGYDSEIKGQLLHRLTVTLESTEVDSDTAFRTREYVSATNSWVSAINSANHWYQSLNENYVMVLVHFSPDK